MYKIIEKHNIGERNLQESLLGKKTITSTVLNCTLFIIQGGAVKIRVTTSDRHLSSGQTVMQQPFLVKISSGNHSPNVPNQSGCVGQENEEPSKFGDLTCQETGYEF